MLYSDRDLIQLCRDGLLDPQPPHAAMQPASIDLRLGDRYRMQTTDGWMDHGLDLDPHPLAIYPGSFWLLHTLETIRVPPLVAVQLHGKSSLARQGLMIHATGGHIDPGFHGQIVLEVTNVGQRPVMLAVHAYVCQITVIGLTSAALRPYGHPDRDSHYQYQTGPEPSYRD